MPMTDSVPTTLGQARSRPCLGIARLTALPMANPSAEPPTTSSGRCAPTYMRPNGTNPARAASVARHPLDTEGQTMTVSAAETAACPDGKPLSPSSAPRSETPPSTLAGRPRSTIGFTAFARTQAAVPPRGDRQREAGPTASEGEGGGRGHGSERAVLHRDPDRPVETSRELVGLAERTYLRLCDRSTSERRGAQQGADAEGEACDAPSRAGHPHAALTGTLQGWSARYEGGIPIDLTPETDHQPRTPCGSIPRSRSTSDPPISSSVIHEAGARAP